MNKKVYFAGSIRGGRSDAQLYQQLIAYINQTDKVLTEHIGNMELSAYEKGTNQDEKIYLQDTGWIKECDVLIAEATNPSLGVGYELAFAEKLDKPCHVLYRPSKAQLSAMITGDRYYHIYRYETIEEAFSIIDGILNEN